MILGGTRAALAAFAAYFVLALVVTWPLAVHPRDHAVGHVAREATPPLNTWAMAVVLHQLRHDPTHLFDGNAFHPYARTLTFSEHLFVPALMGAPVAALTGNRVLAYNWVTLLTLATAGLGGCLLGYEVTKSRAGAFLAGIVYAFHTWNLNEMVRLQILSNQWFPFVLWSLLRFFARPGPARAAAVGAFYALQSLSCMYYALYLPLLAGPIALFLQWRQRLPLKELARLAAAILPALGATALFAVPYVRAASELGFVRPEPESVGLDRYLDVLPGNLLYEGWLGTAGPNQNAAHFLGFSVLALLAVGLWRGPIMAEPRGVRGLLIALGAAGLLLSLGPQVRIGETVVGPGPYSLLFHAVPGFRNVRYPERFCVFLVLAVAPLAAAGLAVLRRHLGALGCAAVCGFAFLEHLALPNVLAPMPSGDQIPAVYRWAASEPDVRVLAEVPASRYRMERFDAMAMYLSTVHWKRTLEGFTSYFPPTYNFAKWRLFHFPDPASVEFLRRFGVDTVIVHPQDGVLPSWFSPAEGWRMEGPWAGGDGVLRLPDAGKRPYELPAGSDALEEVPRNGWEVQGSSPGAGRAVDGDPDTAWTTGGEHQGRGDFYRIRFAGPVELARVSIAVREPFEFPMHLTVMGQTDSDWTELPYDELTAYDGLFASLRHRPRDPWLHLDLEPRRVQAVRLRITATDPFWMPWTMAEVRVHTRQGSFPPP